MTEREQPPRDLEDILDEAQTAGHERFRNKPGTAAHQEAIDREIVLDRELDEAMRDNAAKERADP